MKNKLEEDIVQKVGRNTTGKGKIANEDLIFEEVTLLDGSTSFSFYTYKGRVCILDNQGRDIDFIKYTEQEQKMLYDEIIKSIK